MTHRIDRRRLLAGATATTALLAAPPLVRAQPQALKIAVLLPRSGYLAQAGQSCHRGAQIAGKVLSDHGYRVELVHIDIESSPDISRTQPIDREFDWLKTKLDRQLLLSNPTQRVKITAPSPRSLAEDVRPSRITPGRLGKY